MQNQLSEKTSHHIEEVLKAGKNLHVIKIYSLYGDYARFDDLCLGR
jgi:hypothetical protein